MSHAIPRPFHYTPDHIFLLLGRHLTTPKHELGKKTAPAEMMDKGADIIDILGYDILGSNLEDINYSEWNTNQEENEESTSDEYENLEKKLQFDKTR